MSNMVYVRFSDETETTIIGSAAAAQPPESWPFQGVVEDTDPRYIAFIDPGSTPEGKAITARNHRESLLRSVYDPGINMALRALRMASTPEQTAYAQGKIEELDAYAELLITIPDQPDFPQTITWPVPPTK